MHIVMCFLLFSYTFLTVSYITGYCGEKVKELIHIDHWTRGIRVTETLTDGHVPQHCEILPSICPEDNMPNCSTVNTTIICNYAAKSIAMLVTVNSTSNGTILNVTSPDLTQLYIVNLEGMFVASYFVRIK